MTNTKNLPNLLVVGAQKAGTTTFYDRLQHHKDFFLPHKEIKFFYRNDHFSKGVDWYRKHFDAYNGEKYIGDFTPDYMAYSASAENIFKTLGGSVKIIFFLRHPVKRSYSQFNFYRMNGVEQNKDFLKVLEAEKIDLKQDTFINWFTPANYISRSIYYPQIERFLKYFKKENIHIVIFEELFIEKKKESLRALENFLEVELDGFLDNNTHSNISQIPKNHLLHKLVQFLRKHLKDFIPLFKKIVGPSVYNKVKNTTQKEILSAPKKLDKDTIEALKYKYFQNDIQNVERLMGRTIKSWH